MGGRVVEGTGLENRQAGDRLVGSNPTPSASHAFRPVASRLQTPPGQAIRWSPSIVAVPAVLDPLPDTTVHVVQSEFIARRVFPFRFRKQPVTLARLPR
jgi:hypothetical protein